MAESWTMSVGGRVYGPYSLEQMKGFHAEKRLASHSLIARQGQEQFYPAGEDPELSSLFAPVADTADHSKPDHSKSDHPKSFGTRFDPDAGAPGHFVIVADMKARSITVLEEEIFALGVAHPFGPQAWVLSSEASINTIRNALVQKLGKTDTLFIVDAAHDKAAWFNFGPETDTRIRMIWSRPHDLQGADKKSIKRA
ncbi:MAG TPA: DUF4339 domain-containing protein [Rhizomicrobium sp.]|nr:DUF4339 domain-containing protein [Rhizomicrobium sp.]